MILLVSNPTPEAQQRLDELEAARRQSEASGNPIPAAVLRGYRDECVKTAIRLETCDKCAYCESKVTHVYFADVEHIVPKSRFPERLLDYDNLTLACAVCNNNKGDYFNPAAPILNPYTEDPDDHLVGLGTLVWHRDASTVGQRTIILLRLNRQGLVERRQELLDRLSELADRWAREPEGPVRQLLLEEVASTVDGCGEFTLTAKSFLRAAHAGLYTQLGNLVER